MASDLELARQATRTVATTLPALSLLVLFGSRARADGGPGSDWDIGWAATSAIDPLTLRARLVDALSTDRIDLVDLDRASALLRFRVARDGVVLFERPAGTFARFWMTAVRFWCDVAPVVRAGHDAILGGLTQ